MATWYIGSDKGRDIVQQRQVARGQKDREYGSRMVREGATVNQRGRRKEVVGGGTGSDCNAQRQDSEGTQGKGLNATRDSRIIPRRSLWKRAEDGEKQEAATGGRDSALTDRQRVRQDPDKTGSARADTLRKQAGQRPHRCDSGGAKTWQARQ